MLKSIKQGNYIKFCDRNEISDTETLKILQKKFGGESLSKVYIREVLFVVLTKN